MVVSKTDLALRALVLDVKMLISRGVTDMQISLTNLQDAIEVQRRRVLEARSFLKHDEIILKSLLEELERRLSPENRFDFADFLKFAKEKDAEFAKKLDLVRVISFDAKGLQIEIPKSDHALWQIIRKPIEQLIQEWAGVQVELRIKKAVELSDGE